MLTRIAEILQFNKCFNQKFIFVSLNKLRMSITIQQFYNTFISLAYNNIYFHLLRNYTSHKTKFNNFNLI